MSRHDATIEGVGAETRKAAFGMTPQMDDNSHALETYRSLIQLGTFALKFVQIVNGGGTIAILAYLGDVNSSGGDVPDLTASMASFVLGLLFGGVAIVLAYLTQLQLFNELMGRRKDGGHRWVLYPAIGSLGLSLVAFGCGSLLAVAAFRP